MYYYLGGRDFVVFVVESLSTNIFKLPTKEAIIDHLYITCSARSHKSISQSWVTRLKELYTSFPRYVQEDILQPDDPNYNQFHKIFEAFKMSEMPELPKDPNSVSELVAKAAEASKKLAQQRKYQPQEEEEDDDEEEVCRGCCIIILCALFLLLLYDTA